MHTCDIQIIKQREKHTRIILYLQVTREPCFKFLKIDFAWLNVDSQMLQGGQH